MSDTATVMTPRIAMGIADDFASLIRPYCQRVDIAGSLRRGEPTVHDIEIVCEPKRTPILNIFGEVTDWTSEMDDLLRSGIVKKRPDKLGRPAWGSKYKRLSYQSMPIDLFCCLPPADYGVILMIRTGPADFTHKMVTTRWQHGYMPNAFRVEGGYIQNIHTETRVPARNERELFDAYGLPYLEPHERQLNPEPWRRWLKEMHS